MRELFTHITIGRWEFDYNADIEIREDISQLTGQCAISIPRKLRWEGKDVALGDEPYIVRGDKVVVKIGYDGHLKTRFIGYVKDIHAGMPVKLDSEDSMFALKKGKLTFYFPGGDVAALLSRILPAGMKFRTPGDKSIALPPFRFTEVSPAKILDELKSRMGLYAYFRIINDEPVLFVGLAYWMDEYRQRHTFTFGKDIIDPFALVYKRKEDIRLKAKAISWQRDNTRIETEVGDEDGEQRTIHAYNLTMAELQLYAKAELERYKYTGYRGSLEAMGEPAVNKNDIIRLVGNKYYPDGEYMVKAVTIKSGMNGYKQSIEPGQIITDAGNITGVSS